MSKKRQCLLGALLLSLLVSNLASAKIVGWWKFDEGVGTTVADSSGNGYTGTITGTPQWVPGQVNGALKFSGSANYVECPVIPIATNGTGAISVCCWINRAAAGDHKFCSDLQTANAAGGGFTCAIYNNRMEMDLADANGRVLSRDAARPALPGTNVWVHTTWVYDDGADTLKLYVDGTLSVTATVTQPVGPSIRPFRIASNSPNAGYYVNGTIDDLRLYDHALTPAEIAAAMKGLGGGLGQAAGPKPDQEATDVVRDLALGWEAGEYAQTHDVYLGTVFADVNTASRTSPKGVLVSQGQADTTFNAGRLQFGQTYYWRVDEVNAPPSSTIFKGEVWQFTVEPYSYPLDGSKITATASSTSTTTAGMTPQKTVDGSGLTGDLHGVTGTDMWLSDTSLNGAWIQYAFDRLYKLDKMQVWNSNQMLESILGFGAKAVTVEYSTDGTTWKELGDYQFARAPGALGYAPNTTVDFAGAAAQYVKLTIKSNWGGILAQYGLSEVRFYSVPVVARQPSPTSGAANVAPQVTLSWRAGREAGSHQVLLGTDPNNLTVTATVQKPSYEADVNLDQTYYWKIAEVNQAKDPTTWTGDVWSFSTQKFTVVEDFESYTDDEGKAIWQTWIDGYGVATNGSQVGNANPPYAERTIVHSGQKAMPLFYSNTAGATSSEAERTFAAPQDWSKHGYKTLALSFYGDPNNTGQLYLKINSTKIPYNGPVADLQRAQWLPWNIDLATSGANLKSVTKMVIGIDGAGAAGVFRFDDIRLYPTGGTTTAAPVNPGTTGLVAWYKFDGDFKDSAGAYTATAKGDAAIVSDPVRGQVVSLDGTGDGVAVPLLGSGNTLTIAVWVNTTVDPVPIQYEGIFHCNGWEAKDLHWRYQYGKLNPDINGGGGALTGVSIVKPNQWNHVAVTVSPTEFAVWLNGVKEASRTLTAPIGVTLGEGMLGAWLGTDGVTISRAFTGKMDDARFYNRALSPEELAFLAGRTGPVVQPF